MIIFAFEQNMTYMTQLRMDFEETANSEQYDEWDDIDIDRVNYSHDMKVLNRYPRDKFDKTFVVPDGVVTIAEEAFMGCKHLNKIVLPESLRQNGTMRAPREWLPTPRSCRCAARWMPPPICCAASTT